MHQIAINEILISKNRQRKHFDEKKLADLIGSILSKGLLHPLVLTREHQLVAGERRLRAIKMIHETGGTIRCNGEDIELDHAPAIYLAELDALSLREAELEENVIREDLTWQEHAKAVADLHKLRCEQHGEYSLSTKKGWRLTDTAAEVVGDDANAADTTDVSDSLTLAEFIDDPLISTARNKKEAKRMLREELRRRERQEAIAGFDPDKAIHTLILGNCYAQKYPHPFTCVVADPPYGINIHKHRGHDTQMHEYDDSDEVFKDILTNLPGFLHAVTADAAHAYIFCDIRRYNELFAAFFVAGWTVWDRPLIWDKGTTGSFSRWEYGPRRTYESILYAYKGDKKTTGLYRDVINVQNPAAQDHPAGKPKDLYIDLLKRSCLPGEQVLDPFCGGGTIFAAAQELNLIATGVELNEKYYEMSMNTLKEITE